MTDKEELTRGDALARVAVLEAELAELRKRVSVPSDRDALLYLMERFDSEESNCPVCGHSEATSDMDSANYLRGYLAAAPAPVERVEQEAVAAWRGINDVGEVVTEWIDGAPPERMADLCGNDAAYAKIELAYATPQPSPSSAATAVVGWINEDELPENYPYDAMFPFSKVDIVRMFPVYAPAPDVAGLVEALEGLMRIESRDRVMPIGKEWDAARAAIAAHQQREGE